MENTNLPRLEKVLKEDYLLFFDETDATHSRYRQLEKEIAPTPWNSFVDPGEELELITAYENGDDMIDIIDAEGIKIATVLLSSIVRIHNDDYKRHCVSMLHDLILRYPASLVHFNEMAEVTAEGVPPFPFEPILTVLKRRTQDIFILNKLCGVITILLLELECTQDEDVKKVFSWMTETINKTEDDYTKVVILTNLQVLLKNMHFRLLFGAKKRMLKRLFSCTDTDNDKNSNDQITYQALNCLWILTFSPEVRPNIVKNRLVRNLCKFVANSQNQKILRMSLGLMRNIVNVGDNGEVMVGNKVFDSLKMLKAKKLQFDDEDMADDIEELEKLLEPIRHTMGSFDRFKHEILSGNLEWTSPAHKSDRFWRENIIRFEENDHEVLWKLKDIIEHGEDTQSVAIACWDIGEFIRHHPRGKRIIDELGCKVQIMKLLNHSEDNVKGEALLALQKLMVLNWEYLSA